MMSMKLRIKPEHEIEIESDTKPTEEDILSNCYGEGTVSAVDLMSVTPDPSAFAIGKRVTVSLKGGDSFDGEIVDEYPRGRFRVLGDDGVGCWVNDSVITPAPSVQDGE